MAETIFPELREELRTISHRKPDLIMVNTGQKGCKIIEVTVCFDMHMEQSNRGKLNKYHDLKRRRESNDEMVWSFEHD